MTSRHLAHFLHFEHLVMDEAQNATTMSNTLGRFIRDADFDQLDPIDQALLVKQHKHQTKYAKVLMKRVDRFLDRPPQTTGAPQ